MKTLLNSNGTAETTQFCQDDLRPLNILLLNDLRQDGARDAQMVPNDCLIILLRETYILTYLGHDLTVT